MAEYIDDENEDNLPLLEYFRHDAGAPDERGVEHRNIEIRLNDKEAVIALHSLYPRQPQNLYGKVRGAWWTLEERVDGEWVKSDHVADHSDEGLSPCIRIPNQLFFHSNSHRYTIPAERLDAYAPNPFTILKDRCKTLFLKGGWEHFDMEVYTESGHSWEMCASEQKISLQRCTMGPGYSSDFEGGDPARLCPACLWEHEISVSKELRLKMRSRRFFQIEIQPDVDHLDTTFDGI